MSADAQRPPPGEAWCWQTRELRTSDAWRSAGINARRFIDFLLIEHMNTGGKNNGKLKAPFGQLEAFGITARYVAAAIREAEAFGIVECARGGMRVATTYALTWLPLHDGTPASNRWRTYRNPEMIPIRSKFENLPDKRKAALPDKGKADGGNLPDKGKADAPQNLPYKGKDLYRSSYQAKAKGGRRSGKVERPAVPNGAVAVPRAPSKAINRKIPGEVGPE